MISILKTSRPFCHEEGVTDVMYFMGVLLFIAKIIIPIGLIVFEIIDIAKAVISNDDAAIKKGYCISKKSSYWSSNFLYPNDCPICFKLNL